MDMPLKQLQVTVDIAHGEAVMIGTVYALLLSNRYGNISRDFTKQFLKFAYDNGYPFEHVARLLHLNN